MALGNGLYRYVNRRRREGADVSETTVRPWRDELIALLAAQAPRLDRALKRVS